MNGLIAAGSAASTICQQVCQQVTDNGRTNEVESTENKANKKHALIALVPGSLTGLAAYSAITSGVLASIPTSLLTFFLASPIGWSIGVGTLICGLTFLCCRSLRGRNHMLKVLQSHKAPQVFIRIYEIQDKHLVIKQIRELRNKKDEFLKLKDQIVLFIAKYGTPQMKEAYELLMDSDKPPLPSAIEEFIVGTIPTILKRKNQSEAMKSLEQELRGRNLNEIWAIFYRAYHDEFVCSICSSVLTNPVQLCVCEKAVARTHCNKRRCCRKTKLLS